jgi:hypothetical protein
MNMILSIHKLTDPVNGDPRLAGLVVWVFPRNDFLETINLGLGYGAGDE